MPSSRRCLITSNFCAWTSRVPHFACAASKLGARPRASQTAGPLGRAEKEALLNQTQDFCLSPSVSELPSRIPSSA